MPKTFEDRNNRLALALKEIEKLGVSTDFKVPEPEWYTTGNMAIDGICGGGLPVGKIVELAGPPASGKTTTAVSTAANIIQQGGVVAFFDYERSIDKPYFRALGVEPDNNDQFLYFTPRTLEDGANAARSLINHKAVDLVIFDSVARMTTEKELDAPTGTITVMDRAKMMYQFLRQVVDPAADAGCTIIFLNHLLEKVDMTFIGQKQAAAGIKNYTSPGGNAIPFNASLRLRFELKAPIKVDETNPITNEEVKTVIGNSHLVTVVKNKVGKPSGQAYVANIMGEGFSNTRTAFEILVSYDIIKKNGTWFTIKDARLGDTERKYQGGETVFYVIMNNPETRGAALDIARGILDEAYKQLPSEEIIVALDEDEEIQ